MAARAGFAVVVALTGSLTPVVALLALGLSLTLASPIPIARGALFGPVAALIARSLLAGPIAGPLARLPFTGVALVPILFASVFIRARRRGWIRLGSRRVLGLLLNEGDDSTRQDCRVGRALHLRDFRQKTEQAVDQTRREHLAHDPLGLLRLVRQHRLLPVPVPRDNQQTIPEGLRWAVRFARRSDFTLGDQPCHHRVERSPRARIGGKHGVLDTDVLQDVADDPGQRRLLLHHLPPYLKVRVPYVGRLVGQVAPGEGLGDGVLDNPRNVDRLAIRAGTATADLHVDPELPPVGGGDDRQRVCEGVQLHDVLLERMRGTPPRWG